MARTCPFAPSPAYEEIREEEPVSRVRLPDGGWAWVVSRHEDVRTVLNDRRFSADRQHPDFPQLVKGEAASRRPDEERTLIEMDAPEHGPARKAVLGEFTVRRLEALRPRIQEIVDGQIDALFAAGERCNDGVFELLWGSVVGVAAVHRQGVDVGGAPSPDSRPACSPSGSDGQLARRRQPEALHSETVDVCVLLSGCFRSGMRNHDRNGHSFPWHH
ncbi:hypothetical protein [Nonomuraea sp. NPDC049028]|uniref:hypothetical protein n=1 Tax=Nonomuraea sp. NPDC049028 TaxID=3364348 RepID=UPI003711C4BA